MESKAFTLDVHPPSPAAQGVQVHGPTAPRECAPIQTGTKVRKSQDPFTLSPLTLRNTMSLLIMLEKTLLNIQCNPNITEHNINISLFILLLSYIYYIFIYTLLAYTVYVLVIIN